MPNQSFASTKARQIRSWQREKEHTTVAEYLLASTRPQVQNLSIASSWVGSESGTFLPPSTHCSPPPPTPTPAAGCS